MEEDGADASGDEFFIWIQFPQGSGWLWLRFRVFLWFGFNSYFGNVELSSFLYGGCVVTGILLPFSFSDIRGREDYLPRFEGLCSVLVVGLDGVDDAEVLSDSVDVS